MQDDKSKIVDEDFDDDIEDLDFDDLDDALADEDFDDDIEDLDEEDLEMVSSSARSGSSGFIKKNFALIVVGVVAVGGGLFVMGTMGGGSQSPNMASQSVDVAPTQDDDVIAGIGVPEDMPPMPSPVDAQASQSQDVEGAELGGDPDAMLALVQKQSEEAETLTPLPIPGITQDEDNALLPLEAELPDLAEAPKEDNILSSAEFDSEAAVSDVENTAPSEDLSVAETLSEVDNILDLPSPGSDIQEDNAAQQTDEFKYLESTVYTEEKQNDAGNEALNQELDVTRQELEDARLTISKLESTVSSLEQQVAGLNKAMDDAHKEIKPVQKQEVKPTSVVKKPVKEVPVASWVLRGAQPGSAVLVDKNTQDVRSVEVGETLPGLGKIESIALEQGLWVVRGTKSQVSQ